MKKTITNTFVVWLPLVTAIMLLSGTFYFVVQQYIRLTANEIPAQYAEDVRSRLTSGQPDASAFLSLLPETDLKNSLAPFVIVFDSNGQASMGNGKLNGNYPTIPARSLDIAKQKGENRITWQPRRGLRFATVILPFSINGHDAFVLGGRSLREVEQREKFAFNQVAMGTLLTLFATFVMTLTIQFMRAKSVST